MKRIIKAAVLAIMAAALTGGAAAQDLPDKLVLTLDDSIRMALERNPFYQASKAREDEASAGLRQAVSGFLPSLTAQGTHVLDKKAFSLEFPSLIPGEPPTRVKVDFTRNYQLTLNFSLPISAGGRVVSGYRTADLNLRSTREAIRQAGQEIVLSVKKAFYGWLLAEAFVGVAEEGVNLAEKHLANVRSLYEVGMASKFDLLRSEVQLANLKPQLIRARNGRSTAALALKTLLGLELDRPVEFRGELTFEAVEVDLDADIAQALSNRPELAQLKYQRLMAAEMVKMNKAAYLPTLALGGAYNAWADVFGFSKGRWENFYQINLVLNVPIFNGFVNAAKVGESKALLRQLEFNQQGYTENVKFEVHGAVLALQEARESLLSQEKNVEQAREAVRIAELNYAEGLATNLDVSSAQVALTQAKTNYAQALHDYAVSLAQIEKSTGASQDRYEVKSS